jgi:hypothetical protein
MNLDDSERVVGYSESIVGWRKIPISLIEPRKG